MTATENESENTPGTDLLPWDGNQAWDRASDAPSAFSGSLVNLKNVATHKSVALTIEVPEEHAAALIAAFGWPTRVRPVSVAIARLAGEASAPARQEPKKEHWAEMAPAKQAAVLCKEPDFQAFLGVPDEEGATQMVRARCQIASRRELNVRAFARMNWRTIMIEYGAWLRERQGR